MSDLRTSSPPLSYAPDGDLPEWSDGFTSIPHRIRHASLPSENVCTENLTPFLKLLPCKSLAGIAALLNPHKLFDADWHGMGLHVLWQKSSGVQVRLTFQSVSDPLRTGRSGKQGNNPQVKIFHRFADPILSPRLVLPISFRSHRRQSVSSRPHQRNHRRLAYRRYIRPQTRSDGCRRYGRPLRCFFTWVFF